MENKIEKLKDSWLINNRYQIYKDDGCVYDTIQAKDIPQSIFELRDKLIQENKNYEN